MDKEKLLSAKLVEIFKIFSLEQKLDFVKGDSVEILNEGKSLFKINSDGITIPEMETPESFFEKSSPLHDEFVADEQIKYLFSLLSKKQAIRRLNHIGFCYQVESMDQERKRLKEMIKQTSFHLYEEESSNEYIWLFLGDKTDWKNPLIEFVPVEKTDDQWINYWLPHFQIDIDTNLVAEDIEHLVLEAFNGKIKPYRLIVVDGYVCVVRVRLGIIGGINIDLDFGTEGRMPRYQREKLLKELK